MWLLINSILKFEKDMMELSVEMDMHKTMFAMSGLLDSDFDVKL